MKIEKFKDATGSKCVRIEFDDILEYAEYADEVPQDNESRTLSDNAWAGGTFQDGIDQAKTGNPELVKQFFDGANILAAMIEEEKIGEIRDVVGEYFDVADYLSGEPEVFRRDEYGDRKPVVPVYANFSCSWNVNPKHIVNRGCAIVALCDELSKAGFIVDLHVVEACEWRCTKYYTKINIANDPLDLDGLAFLIANPLNLRRLWFAMFERLNNESDCGGYGSPSEYDLQEIFDTGLSGFYFTTNMHQAYKPSNYDTLEHAKDHVLDMIQRFKESAEQVILG